MSDKLAGVGLCCPSRGVLGGRCGRMGGHRAIGHCCRYTWVAVRPVHAAEGLGLAHAKTWGVESKCPPIWIGGHFTHRAPNGAPKGFPLLGVRSWVFLLKRLHVDDPDRLLLRVNFVADPMAAGVTLEAAGAVGDC